MAKLSYSIGKDLGTLSVNPSTKHPFWTDHGVEKTTPLTVLNGTCETSFQPGIGVTNFSGRRSWKRRWHFQNSTSTRALFGKDVQHESLRCPKKNTTFGSRETRRLFVCAWVYMVKLFMDGWKSSELWGIIGACLNPGSQWENHHRWIITILLRDLY